MKVKLVVLFLLGSLALSLPAIAANVGVEIKNNSFNPSQVTVRPGDTVIWTNQDSTDHTVTGSWGDSGNIDPSKNYSHTFNSAGTFNYQCSIHGAQMSGSVVVQEAEPPPPPPEEPPSPEPEPSPSPSPSPDPEPSPSPAPEASPSPSLVVSQTVTASDPEDKKGMSLPAKLGIIAIVLIGGSGAGLWYLRKNPI